jgi:hypothetical protein
MKKNKTYSLGIMSYCSHDPAAAIIEYDGCTISNYVHFEEGMLSRKKKSYHFPLRAIAACLDVLDIEIEDIDVVATDYMDRKSYLKTSNNYRGLVGDYIRENLKINHSQLEIGVPHHDAHAYAAFYSSGFEEAGIISIDGLGSEQSTHSIYVGSRKNGINKIYEQKIPGIGELYTLITRYLGFESGEEGKVMGLAPYGMDKKLEDLEFLQNLLHGEFDGFTLDYSRQLSRAPSSHLKIKLDGNTSAISNDTELRIYYDDAEVVAAGLDEASLRLYYYNGSDWVFPLSSGVNTTANYVWARTNHFSSWGVFGEAVSTDTTTIGSSGSGACTSQWTCSEWSECTGGSQTRTCSYPTGWCAPRDNKPLESRTCSVSSSEGEEDSDSESNTQNQGGFFNTITGAVIGTTAGKISLGVIAFLIIMGLAWWIISAKKRRVAISQKKAKK